jgi:pyruvate/2-oxoacid:ferredoxin oxidoreductase beta subunit
MGLEIEGPKYYQIFSPCPTGWRAPPEKTVEIARLATKSCVFPIYEIEDGKYTVNKKPKKITVREYFAMQGRFRHLPDKVVNEIQANVDREWELLLKKEEFTKDL